MSLSIAVGFAVKCTGISGEGDRFGTHDCNLASEMRVVAGDGLIS